MNTVIIVGVICLVAGYIIRTVPSLLSIGVVVAALYVIQLGSHGQLPLLNDLMNGVQMLINQQGVKFQ